MTKKEEEIELEYYTTWEKIYMVLIIFFGCMAILTFFIWLWGIIGIWY